MNLQRLIEHEHSKNQMLAIVNYVGDDKKKFAALMALLLNEETTIAQRASWPFSYLVQANPNLIMPYQLDLLQLLSKPNIHDALKRQILKCWAIHMPPKKYWAQLYDLCYTFIYNKHEAIAIQVYAIQVMFNITQIHPAFTSEFRIALDYLLLNNKPAVQSRGRKILKLLNKS